MRSTVNKERYERFIRVDTKTQKLYLVESGLVIRSFDVSTSRYGIGNRENSFQTPPGVHMIIEKIGEGAPAGRLFKDRLDTGIDWHPGLPGENMILTRILRLQGLEPGINNGPGIDTYERYVYIHGTNREDLLGTPMSHGCVCMRSRDIMVLFDSVEEGTIVVID